MFEYFGVFQHFVLFACNIIFIVCFLTETFSHWNCLTLFSCELNEVLKNDFKNENEIFETT